MIPAALALVVFAAVLAGLYEYSGVGEFIKKWAVWVAVVAGFVASGVFLGEIMRNALCAGLWVCK